MPRGNKRKNDEFSIQKWLQRSPKVKSTMALYQKIRGKIDVESFMLSHK